MHRVLAEALSGERGVPTPHPARRWSHPVQAYCQSNLELHFHYFYAAQVPVGVLCCVVPPWSSRRMPRSGLRTQFVGLGGVVRGLFGQFGVPTSDLCCVKQVVGGG